MTGSKNQSIPIEGDVAAAAEKLRQARLADEARRGKENAIAAGRVGGAGKGPGEGDPVEEKAPGKATPDIKEPPRHPKHQPGKQAR